MLPSAEKDGPTMSISLVTEKRINEVVSIFSQPFTIKASHPKKRSFLVEKLLIDQEKKGERAEAKEA